MGGRCGRGESPPRRRQGYPAKYRRDAPAHFACAGCRLREWRDESVGGDCCPTGGGARAGVCFLPPVLSWAAESFRAVGWFCRGYGDRAERARAGAAVDEIEDFGASWGRSARERGIAEAWAASRVRWGCGGVRNAGVGVSQGRSVAFRGICARAGSGFWCCGAGTATFWRC
jgi:hypothetical protein